MKPDALQHSLTRLASGRGASAVLARVLHLVDGPLLRLTRGRLSLTKALTGLPVALVETRGARSGLLRRTPLVLFGHGRAWVAIASSFGRPRHPAWYHNLLCNPECVIWLDGRRQPHRARTVQGDERARLWSQAVAQYPGYELYRHRAPQREIPILLLERAEG